MPQRDCLIGNTDGGVEGKCEKNEKEGTLRGTRLLPLLDVFRTLRWNNIQREVVKLENMNLFPVGIPQG